MSNTQTIDVTSSSQNTSTPSTEPQPTSTGDETKLHQVTPAKQAEFQRLDQQVRDGVTAFMESGKALMVIRDGELWRAGNFESWDSYCQAIAGFTKRHANRLISAVEIRDDLAKVGPKGPTLVLPQSETQLRPLTKIDDPEARRSIWKKSVEDSGGQPTSKTVSAKVVEYLSEHGDPPSAPGKTTTEGDGQVVEAESEIIEAQPESMEMQAEAAESEIIEAQPESVEMQTEAAEMTSDPVSSTGVVENTSEQIAPIPNKNLRKKWCLMISEIRREARQGCKPDKILKLAEELHEDIKSV
jgi:hypothetical protein